MEEVFIDMSLCSHTTMVEIDLGALVYNYGQLRQFIRPSVKFLAVVKADAYGHGAVPVSKRLEELGVDLLGVATVKEGVEMREGGIGTPILVLSGIYQEEVEQVLRYRLTPMVYRLDIAKTLSAEADKTGERVPVHIKVDTGMGRIGVLYEEAPAFFDQVRRFENLEIEGIASHFSTADEEDTSFAEEQLRRFSWTIEEIKKMGIVPSLCHIANSAALFNLPAAHLNLVRLGIMLYGSYPSPSLKEKITLRQVMSWKSRVADLKEVPQGSPISYGRTFFTPRPSLIAAVPIGYADGYSRLFSNRGEVLIMGRRVPVVGRVCMDWTMVDVTDVPGVEAGDEVVLMGRQLDQEIAPEELGEWIGTIPYEIVCSVGKRTPRIYKD
ncbi:MAG: alanine racemase [Deltaproteobacteria bacterium]|nr:MAG: alanine racemase [Deltaproteobacteria bacterium]